MKKTSKNVDRIEREFLILILKTKSNKFIWVSIYWEPFIVVLPVGKHSAWKEQYKHSCGISNPNLQHLDSFSYFHSLSTRSSNAFVASRSVWLIIRYNALKWDVYLFIFKREPQKSSRFYRSLFFVSGLWWNLTTPVNSEFVSLALQ